jgi:predicted negative regulator of RcsB-dependent stress response
MPYKIRVNKKKEAAPLRIVSRSEQMFDQVRTHPKWIWIGAGSVLFLGVLILTVQFLSHRAEEKAWALEAEASKLFHEPPPLPQPIEDGKEPPKEMDKTERLKKSASLYDEIVQKYPRTDTARIAQYESGNVYFELEDLGSAENRYRAFLQKYQSHKELSALVHLKLGYLLQKKGDNASALDHFRTAYEMENGKNKDQAGFELGRSLEHAGKKEEAVETYKKLSERFAQSPWAAEANARLVVLNPPTASAPASTPSSSSPPAELGKEGGTPPAGPGENPSGKPKQK